MQPTGHCRLLSSWRKMQNSFFILVTALAVVDGRSGGQRKPHIVFVMADDLGFNDVGYHGSTGIKTPCIDRLATTGTILDNYYVQPICSPSRSQFMSGRYQIHTGLQHSVIHPDRPFGLPLDNVLLPEQLRSCGYNTHMVGKWHLGFYRKEYLPWKRGFDDFIGILTGGADHYTSWKLSDRFGGYAMYDTRQGGKTMQYQGTYSTTLYTRFTKDIIAAHNASRPLFLYLAYQAPHAPIQMPRNSKQYNKIKHGTRRVYASMVSHLDSSVCEIVEELRKNDMWENTIFVFSTDNGGQPIFGGNNWPLRGSKNTLWEGGIKAVGFVNGGYGVKKNHISKQLFHISDWFPTFLSAAQCPLLRSTPPLDGVDQWRVLSRGEPTSRKEILHNIDPLTTSSKKKRYMKYDFDTRLRAAIRSGPWKLLTGNPGPGSWTPPPEFNGEKITPVKSKKLVQLYNVESDPCENHEMAKERPDVVKILLSRLVHYSNTSVPVWFPRTDRKCNPKHLGGFWGPWM